MKTKMKKKIFTVLLGISALALVASTGVAVYSANAEGEVAQPVLTMQTGAAIRTFAPTGIRFVSEISKTDYETLTAKNAEFYTLIIPEKLVPEGGITADNYKTVDTEMVQAKNSIVEGENTVTFSGTLVGKANGDGTYEAYFPDTAYNMALTAVSYYTYTENEVETVVFANNPQTYSIAYIASALQAKGYTDPYYTTITDSVLGDSLAFASETYVLSKGETLETVLNAEGLKATYSTENETIATVDQNGVVTGVGVGTAQITAKIGNKTATVNVTVTDIFEKPLDDLQLPLYEGSTALPKEYDGFYDSNSLAVTQNGVAVASDKYSYNPATQTIAFNEAGVYELTYTLTYGGISKNLTRSATVGVVNGINSIATECTPWFAPGATADWNQNMVTITDAGISKPELAIDVGDNLLKCTVQKQSYVSPVFALGDFLDHLSELNDSDYLRIWLYYTGTWSGGSIFHEWNFWGTGKPSRLENDLSLLPQQLGSANAWVGLDFTVAEIKAQLEKQNQTYKNFDDFRSNAYLYTMITLSNPCDIYFYSVEFHKEAVREIDASSAQGVTVQEKAIPLNTVEVDASGLEYGKVVEIVNAETGEVIATINGTGSFVMPYAKVKLTVTDIFKKPLDDLQLLLYEGNAALPELYDGLYDSYTLAVKQNDNEIAAGKYTFDPDTKMISFTDPGVYELTYTLTKGSDSKTLTRSAVVGVINPLNDISAMGSWWWGAGENWTQEIVDTDATIGKPSDAADVGNKLLKCTVTSNSYISPVFALGDFFTNLEEIQDNDSIRIWMYYTNTWGANALHYYAIGQQNINDAGDKTTNLPSSLGSANSWVALDISISEIKTHIQNGGTMYGYNAESSWLHTMMNASGNVYFYSIEFHKAA